MRHFTIAIVEQYTIDSAKLSHFSCCTVICSLANVADAPELESQMTHLSVTFVEIAVQICKRDSTLYLQEDLVSLNCVNCVNLSGLDGTLY